MLSESVSGQSLTLSLRYGRLLSLAAVFVHAIPVLSALVARTPWLLTGGITCCVGASLFCFQKTVRERREATLTIFDSGEAVYRSSPTMDPQKADVDASFVDLGWLIVLRLRCSEAVPSQRVALTRDTVPPASWRALRVWLSWRVPLSNV